MTPYYWINQCGNCNEGFYGKEKDGSMTFDSEMYLCKYCVLDTKQGPRIDGSTTTDVIPSKYRQNMKICVTQGERDHFRLLVSEIML